MSIRVQDNGTLRTITGIKVRQGGVTRTIRQVKVQHGDTLRTVATFADPLTVSASPTSVSGTQSGGGSDVLVNTGFTTATPAGGFSPYTYSWAYVSGAAAATANTPSSATTNFGATVPAGTSQATMRVTVTDAAGETATATVTATFNNV